MPVPWLFLAQLASSAYKDKKSGDIASGNRSLTQQQMDMSQAQFDAQMDTSVQRRVADAKKAGIHPIHALGAASGASPTFTTSTGSGQREQRGSATADMLGNIMQTSGMLERNAAAAKRDYAEAALMDAERARLNQDVSATGLDTVAATTGDQPVAPHDFVIGPAEYVDPMVSKSSRPGVESGVHPARTEYRDEAGNVYTLPSPNQGMDEVGQMEYILGIPGRMWANFKREYRYREDFKKLEQEARQLRSRRNNPEAAEWYDRRMKELRAKYAKLRATFERYRSYLK